MLTFVALGSGGTYGHLSIGCEVARVVRRVDSSLRTRLVIDGVPDRLPSGVSASFDEVAVLKARRDRCSRGGSLVSEYSGPDVDGLLSTDPRGTWVFSTFYDVAVVRSLRRAGATTVWLGHVMRAAHWDLFHLDGHAAFFDHVVVLDDIDPLTELLKTTGTIKVVPPPWYAFAQPVTPAQVGPLGRVGISCGGGAVNDSAAILGEVVDLVVGAAPPHVDLDIHVGDLGPGSVPLSVRNQVAREKALKALVDAMDDMQLLVCQAGYCTVHELLKRGLPAIVVPAHRRIDDQALRATSLARRCGAPAVLPAEIHRIPAVLEEMADDAVRQAVQSRMVELIDTSGWAESPNERWCDVLDAVQGR